MTFDFSRKIIVGLLAFFIAFSPLVPVANFAYADINPEINYQGKLLGSTGSAVSDGTYAITFNLYTASSGGSAIWTEARTGGNEVDVTSGLFSVMLGEVSSLSGVDFNQPLWLGITVESDSEMTPRKQLGTVPAAFVSQNSIALGSATSTQYLRSDVAGMLSVSSSTTGLIINQAGSGDIFNLQDGGSEVFTVVDGGNVGIGTTTPGTKLAVAGTARITGASIFDSTLSASGPVSFSSTLNVTGQTTLANASSTNLTVSGNSYLGTVQSGTWNGGVISSTYLDTSLILSSEIDSSSELAGIVTNETGSGSLVFGTSPTFTTDANFFGDTISDFTGTGLVLSGSTLTVSTSSLGITSSQWTTSGSDIHFATGKASVGTTTPADGTQFSIYGNYSTGLYVTSGTGGGNQYGIYAVAPYAAEGISTGIYGQGADTGISGYSEFGTGVSGNSTNSEGVSGSGMYGVKGASNNASGRAGFFDQSDSSGYALYATGGRNYIQNNLGIGTTTPASKLDVWGNLVVGTSSTPALRVDTATGFVGINTTSSFAPLYVYSTQEKTALLHRNTTANLQSVGINMSVLSGFSDQYQKAGILFQRDDSLLGGFGGGKLVFAVNNSADNSNASASDARMVILPSGNVGVGTTTPTARLAVTGASGSTSDLLAIASSTNARLLTVTSAGLVGIGTTTPGAKLHVDDATSSVLRVSSGTRRVSLSAVAADTNYLTSVGASLRLLSSDSDVQVWSNGSVHTYFNTSGQLLMAGTSTAASPGISTYAYNTSGIFFPSTGVLGFSTASTERMRIDSSGNVGIGTTTPDVKLQVTGGSIKLDNNQKLVWRNAAGSSNQNVLYLDALNNTVLTSGSSAIALYDGSASHRLDVYSGATVASRINSGGVSYINGGDFVVGGTTNLARSTIYGTSTSQISQLIRIAPSQTADTFVVEDSAGNDLLRHWTASGLGSVLRVMSTSTKYFQMESYAADSNYFTAAGAAFTIRTNGAFNLNFFTNTSDQRMAISASTGHVVVGSTATNGNARVHSIWNSGPQLRLGVDISNTAYTDATVSSTGATTFNAVGSDPSFSFSDALSVSAVSGSSTIARLLASGTSIPAKLELLGTNSSASQSAQTFLESASTGSSDTTLNFYTRKNGDSFNSPGLAASINQDSVYFKGNVGIGTTTPGMKLDIHAGAGTTAPTIRQTFTDATSYAEWNLLEGSTFKGGLAAFGSNYTTALWRDSLMLTAATNNTGSFIFRTRTGGNYSERMIITNAGSVGIGTTTPNEALTVAGNINLTGALKSNGSAGTSGYLLQTTGSGVQWVATSTLGIGGGSSQWTTSGSDIYYSTGAASIGTTTPFDGSKITSVNSISGSSNAVAVRGYSFVNSGEFSGNAYGGYFSASGVDHGLSVGVYGHGAPGGNYAYGVWGESDAVGVYGNSTNVGVLGNGTWGIQGTSNSPTGRAGSFTQSDSSGYALYAAGGKSYFQNNVGIGTTTPSAKLDVWGNLQVGTSSTPTLLVNTATGNVGIKNANPAHSLSIGSGLIELGGSGTSYIASSYWDTYNTNFTFNTHGSYGITFHAQETGDFAFAGNGSTLVTIKNSGNVGIGTTSPSDLLSVAGSMNLTGALKANGSAGTSGYLLQTTGSGVQWVATSTLGIGGGSSQWTTSGSDIYYDTGKASVGTTTPYVNSGFTAQNSGSAATDKIIGIYGSGRATSGLDGYGGYFHGTGYDGSSVGVYGFADSSVEESVGVWGSGSTIGVRGSSAATGVEGNGLYGIYGISNNASGRAGFFSQSNASGYSLYASGGVNYIQNNLGLGVTSASARLHSVSTTEQLRVGYDASNYVSFTVAADGELVFDSVGTDAEFSFSDNVGINTVGPSTELDIYGSNGGAANVNLMRNDSTTVADDELGGIAFGSTDGPSPNAAAINAYATESYSSSAAGSYLTFRTSQTGGDTIGERMRITDVGNVGIGTTSPQRRLHVRTTADEAPVRFEDSSGYCEINPISTTWSCTSDERLKDNIRDLATSHIGSSTEGTILERVSNLRPVAFTWKSDASQTDRTGLIAQEVEEIFPDLVNTDERGYKSVSYGGFTVYLISAMKELVARLENVENAVAGLTGTMVSNVQAGVSSVVSRLTVGSAEKPTGITLYDEETGEPYCLKVRNGETTTTPGECTVVDLTPDNPPIPPVQTDSGSTTPDTGNGTGVGDGQQGGDQAADGDGTDAGGSATDGSGDTGQTGGGAGIGAGTTGSGAGDATDSGSGSASGTDGTTAGGGSSAGTSGDGSTGGSSGPSASGADPSGGTSGGSSTGGDTGSSDGGTGGSGSGASDGSSGSVGGV